MENLAILVTGSETGRFGQAGHTEYGSVEVGLLYELLREIKSETVRLNNRVRVNALALG